MGGDLILGMEVLVALVATFTFYKYNHNNLRYFLGYVWAVVLLEVSGELWPRNFDSPNLILYNVFIILEFPLLIFWYRSFLSSTRSKRITIWLIMLFVGLAILNSIFHQSIIREFQSYTFFLGALSLILTIFLYFNEVLHTEKILIIQRGLLFWVSVGFLFFYASVIPIMIMGNVMDHTGWIYSVFLLILNIILHTSFLIGLLWGKKKFN